MDCSDCGLRITDCDGKRRIPSFATALRVPLNSQRSRGNRPPPFSAILNPQS
jgi:hypothetical protein